MPSEDAIASIASVRVPACSCAETSPFWPYISVSMLMIRFLISLSESSRPCMRYTNSYKQKKSQRKNEVVCYRVTLGISLL